MPAAIVPASARLGTGTGDDGDPRLQDTAAHSLPDGAGARRRHDGGVPPPVSRWESMEPGTRQLTATAARVTSSQRHLDATIRLDPGAALEAILARESAEDDGGIRERRARI